MNDDQFYERLKGDARALRFEADDVMAVRIAARVRSRVNSTPTVSLFLARWLRPVAASLSAVALAGCLSLVWVEETSSDTAVDSLSADSHVEISMAGDFYSVGD